MAAKKKAAPIKNSPKDISNLKNEYNKKTVSIKEFLLIKKYDLSISAMQSLGRWEKVLYD